MYIHQFMGWLGMRRIGRLPNASDTTQSCSVIVLYKSIMCMRMNMGSTRIQCFRLCLRVCVMQYLQLHGLSFAVASITFTYGPHISFSLFCVRKFTIAAAFLPFDQVLFLLSISLSLPVFLSSPNIHTRFTVSYAQDGFNFIHMVKLLLFEICHTFSRSSQSLIACHKFWMGLTVSLLGAAGNVAASLELTYEHFVRQMRIVFFFTVGAVIWTQNSFFIGTTKPVQSTFYYLSSGTSRIRDSIKV